MVKLTQQDFKKRVRQKYGDRFEILSDYHGIRSKVKIRCNKCDWIGEVIAESLYITIMVQGVLNIVTGNLIHPVFKKQLIKNKIISILFYLNLLISEPKLKLNVINAGKLLMFVLTAYCISVLAKTASIMLNLILNKHQFYWTKFLMEK